MHFIAYIQVTNCLRTALLPEKPRYEIAFPNFIRNTETAVETSVFMVKI